VKRDVNEPHGFKHKKVDQMRYLLSLLLLVLGCTADIGPETAVSTPVPTPTATPTVRLPTINRDWVGPLGTILEQNEPDTFAGIWLDNEAQRVAVAFTEGGEEIIEQYLPQVTDEPLAIHLIELRPAQYSLRQLLADQQTASTMLQALRYPAVSAVMVQHNRVELMITDLAGVEAALAGAGAELPPSVVFNVVYEPVGDPPPFPITPVPDVHMVQLQTRSPFHMAALLIGELVVEEGCLRVRGETETQEGAISISYLIIWQADYFLTENNGRLQILDETGAVVAEVGETIYLGGGNVPSVDESYLREPIPPACTGPYWAMGGFLPEEYRSRFEP
jgi:hypothetical protein